MTVLAPDGVLTTNIYVAGKDWLASQTVSKNGTILNKTAYTYDDKGNLLTATNGSQQSSCVYRYQNHGIYLQRAGAEGFSNGLERKADRLYL